MTLPNRHDDHFYSEAPSEPALTVLTLEPRDATADKTADPETHHLQLITQSVQAAVGDQNFQRWFSTRARFRISGDRLLVRVANPFILNWMLRKFRSALNQAAAAVLGPSATCCLEVDESITGDSPRDAQGELGGSAVTLSGSCPCTPPAGESSRRTGNQSPLTPNMAAAGPAVKSGPSEVHRIASADHGRRRFRNFESFVPGSCNELALLAARQVSAAPGDRYNPLFVYGGTGTGKTHLLEAIYTETRRLHPRKTVMYLSSEAFTNYFTSAVSTRTVPSFRQRFRNVDVLLADNIEFLDNKRATQEEFLHTIVQVIDHGGQVVISSDRHPKLLTKHREELTTRFLSGLVCRMEAPDDATREKLVRSLTLGMKAQFSEDVLKYLVRRCHRNVREIQGALNQLESQFALHGRRITIQTAREILGDLAEECRRLVRISDVERVVCEAFGVTAADLRSASRRKALALPRAIAMYLSRRMTQSAYREIGLYFGGRDHSTVVAAERKIGAWMADSRSIGVPVACRSQTMGELIDELENRLQSLAS